MDTLYLLACAMMLGQADGRTDWQLTPQLATGLELVYAGSVHEESLVPNVFFQRDYHLETRVLVLDAKPRQSDLAIMTALSLQIPVKSNDKPTDRPSSVRLEGVRLDADGKIYSASNQLLTPALLGPPTLELGFTYDAPTGKVKRGDSWEVARPGMPPIGWQLMGQESCNGITCLKIVGQQESDDWTRPRADSVAWRRRDTIWLSPMHLVAQKVERVIEKRDPARQQPTSRTVVRYDLESRLKYPSKLLDERKLEITKAQAWRDEAQAWMKQPNAFRSPIEAQLSRIVQYTDKQAPTPYRKAVLHHKAALESALKGDTSISLQNEEPIEIKTRTVEIGQRVPDFVVSSYTQAESVRLNRCLGQPILVLFYNPATPMGRDVVMFAKSLTEKSGVAILAMAVTNDAEIARKQHSELHLPFPILDGQGMKLTFGVDATPRLVLLDAAGVVRVAQTGWGIQTGPELREALQRFKKE